MYNVIDIAHIRDVQSLATSEQEIITLYSLLLNQGEKHNSIRVKDKYAGRLILSNILKSLQCNLNIYWLTDDHNDITPDGTINFFKTLKGASLIGHTKKLYEFLCSSFHADILIVEDVKKLETRSWYTQLMYQLKELNLLSDTAMIYIAY